jgi:thiosulfate/3-mercaptopyruvate sulfurtransferase
MDLPLILEPAELEPLLGSDELLVVDLCRADIYGRFHIPGAVHLDYPTILSGIQPAVGNLREEGRLGEVLSAIGLAPDRHLVAYDDEGGGKAGRLVWTLEVMGHRHRSLLDGGLAAWVNERHPVDGHTADLRPAHYPVAYGEAAYADMAHVLEHLHDPGVVLVDARSEAEYRGLKRYASRGGHIPGAVHLDWLELMDQGRNLRLKPEPELRALFEERGVTPDKEVIVYCQTHHRSSLTFVALRALGFERVRGYAGAWAEWGNNLDVPVAP